MVRQQHDHCPLEQRYHSRRSGLSKSSRMEVHQSTMKKNILVRPPPGTLVVSIDGNFVWFVVSVDNVSSSRSRGYVLRYNVYDKGFDFGTLSCVFSSDHHVIEHVE